MKRVMTESNYLFDEIFKSNEMSPNIFLINETKEISYLEFNEIVNQISNYLIDIIFFGCLYLAILFFV